MIPEDHVWVFLGQGSSTPGGVFRDRATAEAWIAAHRLSGCLSAVPVDEGVFDWAYRNNVITMKPEKLVQKKDDPDFVATCYPASLEHYRFRDGRDADESV